jgi:DNA polymerase III epsilon subunit-like protein
MPDWFKRATGSLEGDTSTLAKDTAIDWLRYVVLDTELTSLDHRTNRMLSVGAIAMQGPSIQLGTQFYRVVNPHVPIPAESVVIHKLRSEDIVAGERPGKCLADLRQFIEGSVLVGHCVEIELKILAKEMSQTGHTFGNPAIDTTRVHHWILRHGSYSEDLAVQLENLDLATLAKFYSLDVQDAHHALSDAFLTARIWQKMLYTLQAKGVTNLRKLLRIGGARR